LIDLAIDGMRKSPGLSRKIDPRIVRARADPDRHALEGLRPAPDTNVMTLRKSIRLFFKDQQRLMAIDQQGRNRPFFVRMVICHREECFRFRFEIQAIRREPSGAYEGVHDRFLRAKQQHID